MPCLEFRRVLDRKSTRLNSSHTLISYAVFCLKKKKKPKQRKSAARKITAQDRPPGPSTVAHTHTQVPSRDSPAPVSPPFPAISSFFFLRIRRPPRSTLFPSTPLFRSMIRRPPRSTLFPYTPLSRSRWSPYH